MRSRCPSAAPRGIAVPFVLPTPQLPPPIAAVGLLRKAGHEVAFRDFMRIGVPFTLTAVLVGYLYIWFVWA